MDNMYKNMLDLESFTHMLDDPTECYKFYWIESVLNLLVHGKNLMEFDEIIDGMIADAWYSVSKYHLHLGLKDGNGNIMNSLERAVNKLLEVVDISNDAPVNVILDAIKQNEKIIHDEKIQISKMVPYRLLSSFLKEVGGDDRLWSQKKRLIAYIKLINQDNRLPYIIEDGTGLKKKVVIDETWQKMLLDNYVQIKGWIQLKKVEYLQNRNPGVPGIIYKLEPENEKMRKLKQVRELWIAIFGTKPIYDIYSGKLIKDKDFDVDHFVPWSYIANDEIWNLMPMESSLNSQKSNKLPIWDKYFVKFAENQYLLYRLTYENDIIMDKFYSCHRDNLVSLWANEELYIRGHSKTQFINILQKNMKPVYDAARIQGYTIWNTQIDYC